MTNLTTESLIKTKQFDVINWHPSLAHIIHEELEVTNWAPWLAAGVESIAGRAEVFPQGQLLIMDPETGAPLASISTNQINWDGDANSLPSWDDVAGDPTTYEHTHQPAGNTLVLMSANVHPDFQGQGFGKMLIESVLEAAENIGGIEHVIGSFRPTGFGAYKSEHAAELPEFAGYAFMQATPGKIKPVDATLDWSAWAGIVPHDPWFRNLARNGMQPLVIDHSAMVVPLTAEEFVYYQANYKPEMWQQLEDGSWLCGEVGNIYPQADGSYLYVEANLWGQLPFNGGSHAN